MPLLPIVVLAVIQGITEFLPISSSGHLVVAWKAFDVFGDGAPAPPEAEQLVIDIAVHVGTLAAVMAYLWRDVARILGGIGRLLIGRWSPGGRLFLLLLLSAVPIAVAGFLMKRYFGTNIRSLEVIAWASIGFGLLLFAVDRISMTLHSLEHLTWFNALVIGLAQVLALIPGTSRAGITMTAARFFGFQRTDAARFSMLMSIPAIAGAGLLIGYDLYEANNVPLAIDAFIAGGLALISALIAIAAMMAWLRRATFTPFVIYRTLLGIGLLYWVYFMADGAPA